MRTNNAEDRTGPDEHSAASACYADVITTSAKRLQSFVRSHVSGGCRILSEGEACQCLLCDVSRLAGMAMAWNEIVSERPGSSRMNCGDAGEPQRDCGNDAGPTDNRQSV